MDKRKLREKLEGKLLKKQEQSLKGKSLKELVKDFYAEAKKTPSSKSSMDALIEKKVKAAVASLLQKKAKKVREEKDDLGDPTGEEVPVEKGIDLEGDDDDLDLGDEGDEEENEDFDLDTEDDDLDLGDEEDEDISDEDLEGLDLDDEEGEKSDDLDLGDEGDEELDLDLGDEEEGKGDELDSEIDTGEKKEPEMTEAMKKKIRLERMKAKALKFAKKVKEDSGAKAFDPSEGVDATLAGNKDLFDAVPDLDVANGITDKKVPGSDLGTKDASTPPNIPMEKTDAPAWNTGAGTKKNEKLNYKKLMSGEYFKKVVG